MHQQGNAFRPCDRKDGVMLGKKSYNLTGDRERVIE